MNLSCIAEGDAPRLIVRFIGLSIMLDHSNGCGLDGHYKVGKCMMMERETLSRLKRYLPHSHVIVLE